MTKGMGTPRGRDVFKDLERAQDVIENAPPVTAERPADEVPAVPPATVPAPIVQGGLDLNAIRALRPRKEPTVQTNARMPVSLLDDIDDLCRLFGLTKTDIMVDGTRREVARLKKQFGLE
jgi:hypothetical protein